MSTVNFSTQNSLSIAQNYLRNIPSTQMQQIAQTPAETTAALQNLVSTGFDQFANVAAAGAKTLQGPDFERFLKGLAGQFAGMTNQGIEQGLKSMNSQPSPTTLENGQQCCPPPMNQRMGQIMQMMMQMMQMMMQMMQQMGMGQGQGGFPGVQGGTGGLTGLPSATGGGTGLSGGLQNLVSGAGSAGVPGMGLPAASAPLLAPPPAAYAPQAGGYAAPAGFNDAGYPAAQAAYAPQAAAYAAPASYAAQAPMAAPASYGSVPSYAPASQSYAPTGSSGGVSGGTWTGGNTSFTSAASGASGGSLSGLLGSAVGSASKDIAGTTGEALAKKAGLDYKDPEIKAKMDMMAMQQKLQKTQELLDMISKFMTAMHDMNKALIGAWRV